MMQPAISDCYNWPVLKLLCWQHKIDVREEAADETAKRILYTLSVLKHRLPPDTTRFCCC